MTNAMRHLVEGGRIAQRKTCSFRWKLPVYNLLNDMVCTL